MANTTLFVDKQIGGVFSVVDQADGTGNVFFVSSGTGTDSAGRGRSKDDPFATINFACTQCTANNGDRVYVMPGHAETSAAVAGIDISVAGVHLIGIGNGNERPTISFSTDVGATIDFSADDCTFENFIIDETGIDNLGNPLALNGTGVTLKNCRIVMANATNQTGGGLILVGSRSRVIGCRLIGSTTAGQIRAISVVGADDSYLEDLFVVADCSANVVELLIGAATNQHYQNCYFEQFDATATAVMTGFAASTGIIQRCGFRLTNDAQTGWVTTPENMSLMENYGVNNNGEAGILVGTPSV